jgi:hypothetical protein
MPTKKPSRKDSAAAIVRDLAKAYCLDIPLSWQNCLTLKPTRQEPCLACRARALMAASKKRRGK